MNKTHKNAFDKLKLNDECVLTVRFNGARYAIKLWRVWVNCNAKIVETVKTVLGRLYELILLNIYDFEFWDLILFMVDEGCLFSFMFCAVINNK